MIVILKKKTREKKEYYKCYAEAIHQRELPQRMNFKFISQISWIILRYETQRWRPNKVTKKKERDGSRFFKLLFEESNLE